MLSVGIRPIDLPFGAWRKKANVSNSPERKNRKETNSCILCILGLFDKTEQ